MKNPHLWQRIESAFLVCQHVFCGIDPSLAAISIIEALAFFNWLHGLGN